MRSSRSFLWGALFSAALATGCREPQKTAAAIANARGDELERAIAASEKSKPAWQPFLDEVATKREFLCVGDCDCVNGDEYGVYDPEVLGKIANRDLLKTQPREAGPLQALVDLAAQLRRLGVDLLVVVIPAKSTLYPELLAKPPPNSPPGRADWQLRRFMLALEREGIEVLDLFDAFAENRERATVDDEGKPFSERIYRTQDIHWTSLGASVAADAIAARLRRYPWFAAAAHDLGRVHTYEVPVWVHEHGYFGPLERQKRLAAGDPRPIPLERLLVHQVYVSGERSTPERLVDATSPVLVIGDSFADEYSRSGRRAGLGEHLLRALGFAVDVIALGHGSPYTARAAMAMTRPGLKGKKIVVHEMHAVAPFYWDEWKLVDVSAPPDGAAP